MADAVNLSLAFRVPSELAKQWSRGVVDDPALFFCPRVTTGTALYIATLYGGANWREVVTMLRECPGLTTVILRTANPLVARHAERWGCVATFDEGGGWQRYLGECRAHPAWLAKFARAAKM